MSTNDQSFIVQHQGTPIELDICDLLRTMRLDAMEKPANTPRETSVDVPDDLMLDDPGYRSDTASECSSSGSQLSSGESYGCVYLQTIRHQLESYATTGGEYLEAIFTHREILSAYPAAHRLCARGFSDIAYLLEQRAWRADREADMEAVTAFRHEAWSIAASMPSTQQEFQSATTGGPSYVCIMPAM